MTTCKIIGLVTGGARGFGKETATKLLTKGGQVLLYDRDKVKGEETESDLRSKFGADRVAFLCGDVTDENQMRKAFKRCENVFGPVNLLLNNAGIVNESDWKRMLDVNLTAVIANTYLGIEHMSSVRGNHGGMIVNVASVAGLYSNFAAPAYTASKHGVVGFSQSLLHFPKFNLHRVKVNVVCPFFSDTDILPFQDDNVGAMGEAMYLPLLRTDPEATTEYFCSPRPLITDLSRIADPIIELIENSSDGKVVEINLTGTRFVKVIIQPKS